MRLLIDRKPLFSTKIFEILFLTSSFFIPDVKSSENLVFFLKLLFPSWPFLKNNAYGTDVCAVCVFCGRENVYLLYIPSFWLAVVSEWSSETQRINGLSEHLWFLQKSDLEQYLYSIHVWLLREKTYTSVSDFTP